MVHADAGEPRLVTAGELLRMPRGQVRRELVRGVIREMPLRGQREGVSLAHAMMSLGRHVESHRLGGVYMSTGFQVEWNPDTVLSPPAGFIHEARVQAIEDHDGYIPGAPDLAIEAVSWCGTPQEMEAKAAEWLAAGCPMIVVLDPERRTATVHRSRNDVRLVAEDDELDGGDVVPGWRLPLREVFTWRVSSEAT